ncbi:N-acyl-D-glucosamine 2-epimerase [Bifidobacterium aquikefiri]|uniref:N-acyl-D-glucosamine 2-epimerase n=1 Tax=Bifidobacterium aquikefiri TaxID=1653207 RepID=A0A261G8W9_9BIFI|nr:AGE family epimerase/isomerase [Bifidobacterium aquikefiri]OZG67635.1 N-acyl-D-glucosamine 2-epimerase [Bifidobacterium aquikefiri]
MSLSKQANAGAYVLGTDENREFLGKVRDDLLGFGHRFPAPQGGSYWLDDVGEPDPSEGIQTWITCRMTHVYSLGAIAGHEGSTELVDAALRGLKGILHDDRNGGWYPSVSEDGTPEPGKVCYTHAFVMLASASATLIGRPGARELLDEATATFLTHFWDDEAGLAVDTWNTEFTELDPYRGVNANMHTTEAFLALADVLEDETWRRRAGRIVRHVVGWSERNEWRIPEHFTADWVPDLEFNADKKDDQFKPYGATPGHGIEWARLITQYALSDSSLDKAERDRLVEAAEALFRRAVEDGWATTPGGRDGLAYTTDWAGKPVVTDRMHWTLAEAVNTSATLFAVTQKQEYAQWYSRFWAYIDEYLIDHDHGSWFHQLDCDNRVIATVWPGKSDLYHALQCTLIPLLTPSVSVAPALKEREDGIAAERGGSAAARQLRYDAGRFPASVAWSILTCM